MTEKATKAKRIETSVAKLVRACSIVALIVVALPAARALEPEIMGSASAPAPGPHWFFVIDFSGIYVFDAASGEMQGN